MQAFGFLVEIFFGIGEIASQPSLMNNFGDQLWPCLFVHGYILSPFVENKLFTKGHPPEFIIDHAQLQALDIISDLSLYDLVLACFFILLSIDVDRGVDDDSRVGEMENIRIESFKVKVLMPMLLSPDLFLRGQHLEEG